MGADQRALMETENTHVDTTSVTRLDNKVSQKAKTVIANIRLATSNGSLNETLVLLILAAHGGQMTLSDLYAQRIATDAATRSYIRRLQALNWVDLSRTVNDGRAYIIRLTDQGSAGVTALLSKA